MKPATLPVNELFDTIQGEATWTGTPSLFVRLQGCAVGCPWCDTKHTWAVDDRMQTSAAGIMLKEKDSAAFARLSVEHLLGLAVQSSCRHVVITGGEPCDYDLTDLTQGLVMLGKSVQVETSGTSEVVACENAWITLSPKINMPGGKPIIPQAVERSDEIKMPVGKQADIDQLNSFLDQYRLNDGVRTIWLQPLSKSEKATQLCIAAATANGWRVSVQVHKFLGVR